MGGRIIQKVILLLRSFAAAAMLAGALTAAAQQEGRANGVFLVAKPGLVDPNFRQTVVLVTQTEDASTFGVILNRPTRLSLREFLPGEPGARNYRDPIFFGGPVMRQSLVALFRADSPPHAPAFHVLKGLYLTMHPDNIRPLLAGRERRYRLYAGFSGWAPRQLESELKRDGWYVLPANAETALRRDTDALWQELVRRAEARQVNLHKMEAPPRGGAVGPESPGDAARAAPSMRRP
jgi:putative transcriptional regulator